MFNNAKKQECGKVADVIFTMLANTRCLTYHINKFLILILFSIELFFLILHIQTNKL